MKRIGTILAVVAVSALSVTSRADETTFCNQFITTLPYTIATQGHYCFDRNLATAITTGAAIAIHADFVVLDLNNFKLGGGSAGLTTFAVGISANNQRNITIRNGNIRGFYTGILISGTGGHLIENNVLDGNTFTGLEVRSDSAVIRNNIIANTGGTSFANDADGIMSYSYGLVSIRDNVVSNTFGNGTGNTYTYGIWTRSAAIADHNVVRMGAPSSTGHTVGIAMSNGICRDNTTLNATTPNSCSASVGANYP